MSILFVLLMFLLIMSISYFRSPQPQPQAVLLKPRAPRMAQEMGFQIPEGYAFHPGHMWLSKEGPQTARVGLDSFAGRVIGQISKIELSAPNRWVRQGQKLASVMVGDKAVEFLSPVEGVVTAVNSDVVADPSLASRDPYEHGWLATIKSPDLAINQKNLVQGPMVAPWMQNNIARLNAALAQMQPALAQDGGLPVGGLLSRVTPDLREKIVKEFFLS
jgi:glycine cleavage system H lipoate-binding protein